MRKLTRSPAMTLSCHFNDRLCHSFCIRKFFSNPQLIMNLEGLPFFFFFFNRTRGIPLRYIYQHLMKPYRIYLAYIWTRVGLQCWLMKIYIRICRLFLSENNGSSARKTLFCSKYLKSDVQSIIN